MNLSANIERNISMKFVQYLFPRWICLKVIEPRLEDIHDHLHTNLD
jgi:hypothetical protein